MFFCCIIKPRALHISSEIIHALATTELCVIRSKLIMYDLKLVDVLYDHMDLAARSCISMRYGGRHGMALLISAQGIDTCVQIIGTESNPRKCTSNSIRARFGDSAPVEYFGTWTWWENAVHRPVDERERLRDLRVLFPEYAESAG